MVSEKGDALSKAVPAGSTYVLPEFLLFLPLEAGELPGFQSASPPREEKYLNILCSPREQPWTERRWAKSDLRHCPNFMKIRHLGAEI